MAKKLNSDRRVEGYAYNVKSLPPSRLLLPIMDKVVVKKDEAPQKFGVIIVPPSYRDQQPVMTATVVATGPEVQYVRPGDYVVVSQYEGTNVKVDGYQYTVLRESGVHLIIQTEAGADTVAY